MANKYINADETKGKIGRVCFCRVLDDETEKDLMQTIDEMPSADVVEVVRCKDCKYWSEFITPALKTLIGYDGECTRYNRDVVMNLTNYCSYGERKDKNE